MRPRDCALAEQIGDFGMMSPPAFPLPDEAAPPPIGEGARDAFGGWTTVARIGDSEWFLAGGCNGAITSFGSGDEGHHAAG